MKSRQKEPSTSETPTVCQVLSYSVLSHLLFSGIWEGSTVCSRDGEGGRERGSKLCIHWRKVFLAWVVQTQGRLLSHGPGESTLCTVYFPGRERKDIIRWYSQKNCDESIGWPRSFLKKKSASRDFA